MSEKELTKAELEKIQGGKKKATLPGEGRKKAKINETPDGADIGISSVEPLGDPKGGLH